VKYCVDFLHRASPGNSFYQSFDAFYNPATVNVENNVVFVGGQEALFVFNKCMAEQGVPLKY